MSISTSRQQQDPGARLQTPCIGPECERDHRSMKGRVMDISNVRRRFPQLEFGSVPPEWPSRERLQLGNWRAPRTFSWPGERPPTWALDRRRRIFFALVWGSAPLGQPHGLNACLSRLEERPPVLLIPC
jgi:hypothetical protein